MGEEMNLWGVATRRRRGETQLLSWMGTAPAAKPFRFYPVFSSRERAEEFVREHGQELMVESPQLMEELIEDIRKIKRNEIPEKHYILSERKGFFVTWVELLGES
jgi:hypothetical protein